ncbi:MAG: hypothetical protein KTR32_26355 [Granulosicoccus sp.]|nr:hypothetical protein [Granulosicoccus sp.]
MTRFRGSASRSTDTVRSTCTSVKQKGSALMVAMIMIFVMSLLGVSMMRSSTLGGRMVTNAFEKDLTFQAADSATDFIVDDKTNLEAVICKVGAETTDVDSLESGSTLETVVDVSYGGEGIVPGYSLAKGIAMMRFTATGTSTLVESGTSSSISQGVYILGAKSEFGGC